jgi:hypothetical protein
MDFTRVEPATTYPRLIPERQTMIEEGFDLPPRSG